MTARCTAGHVRMVGQEPAPSKCVLMMSSRRTRIDLRDWVFSQEGDKWSFKFSTSAILFVSQQEAISCLSML